MSPERDIYVVSVPRKVRVQHGPLSKTPSKWRNLSRREVRSLIAERVNGGCLRNVKVFIETRAETNWLYGLAIYGRRLAKPTRKARGSR